MVGMDADIGGSFPSTLDEKGRLSIPIKLRDRYSGELVVTMGLKNCGWIMSTEVWEHLYKRLMKSGEITEGTRQEMELRFVAPRILVEVDKTGRIALPKVVRSQAGLIKDCLVLNLQNRLEVWDEEAYAAHLNKQQPNLMEAVENMGPMSLFELN
jgi:MraZ protein